MVCTPGWVDRRGGEYPNSDYILPQLVAYLPLFYPFITLVHAIHQRVYMYWNTVIVYIVFPLKRSVDVKTCIRLVCKSVRFVYKFTIFNVYIFCIVVYFLYV